MSVSLDLAFMVLMLTTSIMGPLAGYGLRRLIDDWRQSCEPEWHKGWDLSKRQAPCECGDDEGHGFTPSTLPGAGASMFDMTACRSCECVECR